MFRFVPNLLSPIFAKIMCFQDVPIISLVFLKYFGNKYGVHRSRLGRCLVNLGSRDLVWLGWIFLCSGARMERVGKVVL